MGDDINTRETRYQTLRISNFDRLPQSISPSNFKVNLKNNINLQQALELYIHSITVPNVFYNIDTHNNTLIFTAVSSGGGITITPTITITPGYYTTAQLMNALKIAMDLAMIPVSGTIAFTLDAITNLISFQTTSLDGVEFLATGTIEPFLGLNTALAIATSGTFDGMPSLRGEQIVFIHSKDLTPSKTQLTNDLSVSSFVSIPITVPYLDTQSYRPATDETNKIIFNTQTNVSSINIKLRAQDGRILTLSPNQELVIVFKMYY